MIKQKKGDTGPAEVDLSDRSDPILGGVGRGEYGTMDWSDMQVAKLERLQEYERESARYDDDSISEEERLDLNALDAAEKELADEAHEEAEHQQHLAEAAREQEAADAAYEQHELLRMAESERAMSEFPGPTLSERAWHFVARVRDWLGI